MRVLVLIATGLMLFGCAATPDDFSQAMHEKAKAIVLFEPGSPPAAKYNIIKDVQSNSCQGKWYGRYTGDVDEAMLLLRLEAATVNANAVVDYRCWTQGFDLKSNCWASKRCEGKAVKFEK